MCQAQGTWAQPLPCDITGIERSTLDSEGAGSGRDAVDRERYGEVVYDAEDTHERQRIRRRPIQVALVRGNADRPKGHMSEIHNLSCRIYHGVLF